MEWPLLLPLIRNIKNKQEANCTQNKNKFMQTKKKQKIAGLQKIFKNLNYNEQQKKKKSQTHTIRNWGQKNTAKMKKTLIELVELG